MPQYSISQKQYETLLPLAVIKRNLWMENDSSEDETLKEMLRCAIDAAESFLRRCIVSQTVLCSFERFSSKIRLPIAFATEFIEYTQEDNWIQGARYFMDRYNSKENMLELDEKKHKSIIKITYKAGWHQGKVPQGIKQGVLQHIYNMYHNQSPALIKNNDSIELYQPYRRLVL